MVRIEYKTEMINKMPKTASNLIFEIKLVKIEAKMRQKPSEGINKKRSANGVPMLKNTFDTIEIVIK